MGQNIVEPEQRGLGPLAVLPTDEEDDCCVGELIAHGQFMFVHSRECQRPKAKAYWKDRG